MTTSDLAEMVINLPKFKPVTIVTTHVLVSGFHKKHGIPGFERAKPGKQKLRWGLRHVNSQ